MVGIFPVCIVKLKIYAKGFEMILATGFNRREGILSLPDVFLGGKFLSTSTICSSVISSKVHVQSYFLIYSSNCLSTKDDFSCKEGPISTKNELKAFAMSFFCYAIPLNPFQYT